MTTIAYRDGVLAADSRMMSSGWIRPGNSSKLRRMGDGALVAVAGEYARLEPFLTWLGRFCPPDSRPSLGDNTTIIVLSPARELLIYEDGGHIILDPAGFHAWGSGWPAAVAAMHMGADARRAVEIAALVDECTGGAVVSMRLDDVIVDAEQAKAEAVRSASDWFDSNGYLPNPGLNYVQLEKLGFEPSAFVGKDKGTAAAWAREALEAKDKARRAPIYNTGRPTPCVPILEGS